jgi:hypothetical protein
MADPVNVTVDGEFAALLVTTIDAPCTPLAVGANVTDTVQYAPTATDEPQLLVCAKFPFTAPVRVITGASA